MGDLRRELLRSEGRVCLLRNTKQTYIEPINQIDERAGHFHGCVICLKSLSRGRQNMQFQYQVIT